MDVFDHDWRALGFRCGLEIHHQIITDWKLFCRCPAGRYVEGVDAEVMRHMRPTLSELGEYDGTALMEFKTRKEVVYQLQRDTVCTYEMDDTPPFHVNLQALDRALVIALGLRCSIVGELHVIRKQYLDGSIPTGFQRTAIVGVSGAIPLAGRELGVIQLGLEEDACREVSDVGHVITFKTDRLSTPLVEVVTESECRTPFEAEEAGRTISRLLRATGLVRRGIGRGRQDVNVSVAGGTRCEIKGVHRIPCIPRLTAIEALRQKSLLDLREKMLALGLTKDAVRAVNAVIDDIVVGTENAGVRAAVERGHVVRAVALRACRGLLDHPTQPGLTFAHEMSGRVRVIACLDERPNIVHNDRRGAFSDDEWKAIARRLDADEDDAIVVTWGAERDTVTAANEIEIRVREAAVGVPNETRQAMRDGTTDFERILPGPDRMYPDTDSPPLAITDEMIERARVQVPEMPWSREARYREMRLPEDVVRSLPISRRAALFDRVVGVLKVDAGLAGVVLEQTMRALKRKGVRVNAISDDVLFELFASYAEGRFTRDGFAVAIRALAESNDRAVRDVLTGAGFIDPASDDEVRTVAKGVVASEGARVRRKERAVDALMRHAMGRLRGRAEGRIVKVAIYQRLLDSSDNET